MKDKFKTGDFVWFHTINGNRIGRILQINPYGFDGSKIILYDDKTELWRFPYEICLATNSEVVLYKMENV